MAVSEAMPTSDVKLATALAPASDELSKSLTHINEELMPVQRLLQPTQKNVKVLYHWPTVSHCTQIIHPAHCRLPWITRLNETLISHNSNDSSYCKALIFRVHLIFANFASRIHTHENPDSPPLNFGNAQICSHG